MPPKKLQQLDTNELLNDIRYLNQASEDEIKQISNRIRLRIAEADLAGNVTDAIIDEVSIQLGQLTAKVKLAEKVIRSISPGQKRKSTLVSSRDEINSNRADIQFSAYQLAGGRNLLPIETSPNGVSYVWSSSDPEICFTFPLDRSKAFGMQIRLFALVKSKYSKQLKVLIDGTHVRHRFHVDEALYVVSCNLPPSSKTSRTEIKIVLPATHSPMDLGNSTDGRKLGIAINQIRFGKPESGFAHLLRRLKLKV